MILGVLGLPGGGKTYTMVRMIRRDLRNGIRVFSNIKIDESKLDLKPKKGIPLGKLYYWKHLHDFRGVFGGNIYVDEAGAYFNARNWQNISEEDLVKFMQHRKDGLNIIYSAQNFDHVDKMLRQLTAEVIEVHNFFARWFWYKRYYPENVNDRRESRQHKGMPRLFFFDERIAEAYDSWERVHSAGEQEYIERVFKPMSHWFEVRNSVLPLNKKRTVDAATPLY